LIPIQQAEVESDESQGVYRTFNGNGTAVEVKSLSSSRLVLVDVLTFLARRW
jgi:hypothetical protein